MKVTKIIAGAIAIILALVGIGATAAQSDVLWRGDAETGDLSQWEVRAPGQISVVTNPVGQGRYAYKFVLPADFVSQGGKEAVWLSSKPFHSDVSGEEKYYGWQVFIPADYPTNSAWALVMQFKGEGTGSPPVALGYRNNSWSINNNPVAGTGNNVVLARFGATKGRWERFVFHIKWSPDPSVGFIEAWHNGNLILPLKHVSTIHLSGGNPVQNYIDMGMYRDPSVNDTVTFYHDGFIVCKTYVCAAGGLPPVTGVPTQTNTALPITRTPTASRTPTQTPIPFTVTPSLTPPVVTATFTPTTAPTCFDVFRFRNGIYEKIGNICP